MGGAGGLQGQQNRNHEQQEVERQVGAKGAGPEQEGQEGPQRALQEIGKRSGECVTSTADCSVRSTERSWLATSGAASAHAACCLLLSPPPRAMLAQPQLPAGGRLTAAAAPLAEGCSTPAASRMPIRPVPIQ